MNTPSMYSVGGFFCVWRRSVMLVYKMLIVSCFAKFLYTLWIYGLFQILFSFWHTDAFMECVCACMYVHMYVRKYALRIYVYMCYVRMFCVYVCKYLLRMLCVYVYKYLLCMLCVYVCKYLLCMHVCMHVCIMYVL